MVNTNMKQVTKNMKQTLYTDEKVEENDYDLDTKRDRWDS